jgi:hypothetical protein
MVFQVNRGVSVARDFVVARHDGVISFMTCQTKDKVDNWLIKRMYDVNSLHVGV